MNSPTEISPSTQLLLDELRKLSGQFKQFAVQVASWGGRVPTQSTSESRIGVLKQPDTTELVVADNWGGMFEPASVPEERILDSAAADSSSPPLEKEQHALDAHVVADHWGGEFEETGCVMEDPAHDYFLATTDSASSPPPPMREQDAVVVPDNWAGLFEQRGHTTEERGGHDFAAEVVFAGLASTDQIHIYNDFTYTNSVSSVCFTPAPNVSDAATSSTKEKDPVEAFQAEYQIQKLEKLPSSTTGKAAATVEFSIEREKRTRNFLVGDPSAPPPPQRAPLIRRPRCFPPRPPRPRRRRRAPPLPLRLRRPRRPPWLCRPLSPRTRGPRRAPPWRGRPLHRLIWRPPWRLASFNRRPRRRGHRVRGYSLRPGQRRRPPRLQGHGRRPRLRARALLPHPGPVRHPVRTPPHRQRGRARRILGDAAPRQSRPEPSRRLPVQAGLPRCLVHAQHQLKCHHHIVYLNLPQGPPWQLHNRGVPAAISIHAQVVLDEMQQRYNTNLTSAPWMGVDLSGSSATTTVDNQKVFEELSAVQLVILDDNVYTFPVRLMISQPTILLWEFLGCIQEYKSTFIIACLVVGLEGMDPCRNQQGLREALNLLLPMYLSDGFAWRQQIPAAKTFLDINRYIAGHMASVYTVGSPCYVGAANILMAGILCETLHTVTPHHHDDGMLATHNLRTWLAYDMISVILLDKLLADHGCVGVPCSEAYNNVLYLSVSDQSFVAQVDLFRLEPWDPGGKQLLLFVDMAVCVLILQQVQRKCGGNCQCFLLEVIGQKSQVAGRKVKDHCQAKQGLLRQFSSSGPSCTKLLKNLLCYFELLSSDRGGAQNITIHSTLIDLGVFGLGADVRTAHKPLEGMAKYDSVKLWAMSGVAVSTKPCPFPLHDNIYLLTSFYLLSLRSFHWGHIHLMMRTPCPPPMEFDSLNGGAQRHLFGFNQGDVMFMRPCPPSASTGMCSSTSLISLAMHKSLFQSLYCEFSWECSTYVLELLDCNALILIELTPSVDCLVHLARRGCSRTNLHTFEPSSISLQLVKRCGNCDDGCIIYGIYHLASVPVPSATKNELLLKLEAAHRILLDWMIQKGVPNNQVWCDGNLLFRVKDLQVPWDPGGAELLHRLGGKPKLKKGGMLGTRYGWAFIWAMGLAPVQSCFGWNEITNNRKGAVWSGIKMVLGRIARMLRGWSSLYKEGAGAWLENLISVLEDFSKQPALIEWKEETATEASSLWDPSVVPSSASIIRSCVLTEPDRGRSEFHASSDVCNEKRLNAI